jgi:hypothetical protein
MATPLPVFPAQRRDRPARRAAAEAFFTSTWNLSVAARQGDVVYLRGTGADHHLLSLHPSDKAESGW